MAEVVASMIEKRTVRPSEKTWTGTMKLTEIDMSMTRGFVPKIYLYRGREGWDRGSITRTLEESLGKALVRFYPFMGRLQPTEGGRCELVVDDSDDATWGVPFVEAEADVDLAEFGDDGMLGEALADGKFGGLFPVVEYGVPLPEMALFTVQVTHFRCGGLALAFAWSHAVVDGAGAAQFYKEWTRLARGEPLGVAPVHDRGMLRAGETSRSVPEFIIHKEPEVGGLPPFGATTSVRLSLSKTQINKLKQLAGQVHNGSPYSRFEALAAHVWRCASKARGHEGKKQNVLGISINIRKRVNPALPQEFAGNAVINLSATSESESLISNPLGEACNTIRQTLGKVNDDLVWAFIDYQKTLGDLGAWRGIMTPEGSFFNPDVMMVSWMNLGFNNLDFGWGNEVHWASKPHGFEGVACLLDGPEDGETIVVICLQFAHVDKFKECFFDGLI